MFLKLLYLEHFYYKNVTDNVNDDILHQLLRSFAFQSQIQNR